MLGQKAGKVFIGKDKKKFFRDFLTFSVKVFLGDLTIITWHGRLRLSLCCCLAEGATLRPVWTTGALATCDEVISKVILPWVIFNVIFKKQQCSKTIFYESFWISKSSVPKEKKVSEKDNGKKLAIIIWNLQGLSILKTNDLKIRG